MKRVATLSFSKRLIRFKSSLLKAALAIALPTFASLSYAQDTYRVGQIVENFTLINRDSGEEVSLHDLEGKIVFLEWFAYWCPFCQAAAEEVKTGIVNYYTSRGGNLDNIPVMHVGVNLQGDAESLTDSFVALYGMKFVLNDFDRAVASRFQPSGQPIFAIINGVSNSPSHQQWELVYSHLGYGNLTQPIDEFRAAIDSVEAGPDVELPTLLNPLEAQTKVTGEILTLRAEVLGTDLDFAWSKDGEPLPESTSDTLHIDSLSLQDAGTYSVVVSNAAGSLDPLSAEVVVYLSADDYLAEAGLIGNEAAWGADPDRDGSYNIFEYLAQTDPLDSTSKARLSVKVDKTSETTNLSLSFPRSDNVGGVAVDARFGHDPEEMESLPTSLPLSGPIDIEVEIPPEETSYFGRLHISLP